jgi:hypothetical protein
MKIFLILVLISSLAANKLHCQKQDKTKGEIQTIDTKDSCNKKLLKLVQECWRYDEAKKINIVDPKFEDILLQRFFLNCIPSLDTNQITALLGNHCKIKRDKTSIQYTYKIECKKTKARTAEINGFYPILIVRFNKSTSKLTVFSIDGEGWSKDKD